MGPSNPFLKSSGSLPEWSMCACVKQHKVQLPRRDGQRLVDKQVLPLLHAAVNKAAVIPALDECAAARNFMGRAQKVTFIVNSRVAALPQSFAEEKPPIFTENIIHVPRPSRKTYCIRRRHTVFVVPAPREHGALSGAPLQFPFSDSTFAVCGEDILR